MRFESQVIVVTGGGSGIGEATVRRLAREGAAVVVADVAAEQGGRVVADVERDGGRAAFVETDVSREPDAEGMVEFALSTYGRLDGAVNNAGVALPVQRLHEADVAGWDRVHGVDLRGVWLCMRAELRHFLTQGRGAIVNTASIAGLKAVPGQGPYVAAKHGVVGLTRQAGIEYVRDGIRVNAVAPGLIATPQFLAYPEQDREMYANHQPGGRAGEPAEVAAAIAWLLSDEASFVTGEVLTVDHGVMQQ